MRFEKIRYMDWAKRQLEAAAPAFNLASSGLQLASPEDVGLEREMPVRLLGENTFGHPGLRARLAAHYGVGQDRVLTAGGTSLANFLVEAALLRPGDGALCEWPAYEPLWRTLEALEARVEFVERPDGAAPDLERVRLAFARGTRLLVLSDLHNPTGALLEREAVREIGRLAARYDAWVLVDEVYLSGVFEGEPESAARLGERLIATASLTKTFGLGKLRAGWAIAPPAVVERCHEVNDHLAVDAPFLAEEAALRALERLDVMRERARARREETWPLVRDFARDRHLRIVEPRGGFFVWIELPEGLAADPFAARLRERHETQVAPGSFFGAPGHIRVGHGARPDVVREGLRRLGLALDELARPA
jgi:aspartate/methionine/tyrosine aminotransferase